MTPSALRLFLLALLFVLAAAWSKEGLSVWTASLPVFR